VRDKQTWAAMTCLLVLSGFGCAARAQATDQDEPLPEEIRRVVARVQDDHGNAISGLARDDFTLRDNGQLRPIQSAQENTHAQILTIVVLDQLNTAAGAISRSALSLEKSLRSESEENLCIYLINPEGRLVPIRSVTDYAGGVAAGANTADRLLKESNRTYPVQADLAHNPALRFNSAVIALHGLLRELEGLPQPRNMLLVTAGFVITNYKEECRKLAGDVSQVSAPMYVLQPGPSASVGDDGSGFAILSKQECRDEVARLTGGDVLVSTDMEKAIVRAQADLRTSYTIEYVEHEEERRDDYHTVLLACKRAGVHVRYQQTYFALRP
jgi:VWFA-related protein